MHRVRHGVRAAGIFALFVVNLILWGTPIFLIGGVKFFIRNRETRRKIILFLAGLAENWVAGNDWIIDRMLATKWDVTGNDGLNPDARYLLIANHQSWIDIVAIFRVFHGRLPFIRFFLKRQLLWLPIAGFGCWALEFPFMNRYSQEYLARHPEKRGADLVTTRRACRRYTRIPVAMMNFLEGTRFTWEKHANQDSPYRHLLRPRVGGIAYVLATMGEQLNAMLDVTIAYPDGRRDLWSFLSNRVPRVVVRVRQVDLPPEFLEPALAERGEERARFKQWVLGLWEEKDRTLDAIL